MTVKELIEHLKNMPQDIEVFLDVRGLEAKATDVDYVKSTFSEMVLIHDYPVEGG